MKNLILGIALLFCGSAFAMDDAARFVEKTLNSGLQLVTQPRDAANIQQVCGLVDSTFDTIQISQEWLGNYKGTSDLDGAVNLEVLTLSIVVTKIYALFEHFGATSIVVNSTANDFGDRNFSVEVTISTPAQNFAVHVLVSQDLAGNFSIEDFQPAGISAVRVYGQEVLSKIDKAVELHSFAPVTDAVISIRNDPNLIQCP